MKDAEKLLEKYKAGTCTPRERMLVEKWFHHLNEDQPTDLDAAHLLKSKDTFRRTVAPMLKHKGVNLWQRLLVAAAVLVVIAAGIYLFRDPGEPETLVKTEQENDLAPGGNKATLTLADGTKISLTDAQNGELAQESGISIVKTSDGQVVYTVSGTNQPAQSASYNKIETPVGGQYQVNLPDGSMVWLNSASSLRYPVQFAGSERKVEITGEAYFEVSHDASRPFRVVSGAQTVEVLGTSFNIMAYDDELATNTTLIEGSVRVSGGDGSKVIKPGQQSSVSKNNISVKEADIDGATAWKNGYFIFKAEEIGSIMRKISRWYQVKVEYEGVDMGKVFGGKISRSRKVSEVLKLLESTGSIHFKLIPGEQGKERRLIVMP